MEGKVFSEQTKTVLISRHGAGIVSEHILSATELIMRRWIPTKAEIRVVGQLGSQDQIAYGRRF
jgi:hypothetical protein